MNLPIEIRYHISSYISDEEVLRLKDILQIGNSYILAEMENENPAVSLMPLLRLERKLSRLRQTDGYKIAQILCKNSERIIEKRWCENAYRYMTYICPITVQERDMISKLFEPRNRYAPKIKGPKSIFIISDNEDLVETIRLCMKYMFLL